MDVCLRQEPIQLLFAIKIYANDRDFQRALDEHYNNLIDPAVEYWSP
jgi:hypothetical protein